MNSVHGPGNSLGVTSSGDTRLRQSGPANTASTASSLSPQVPGSDVRLRQSGSANTVSPSPLAPPVPGADTSLQQSSNPGLDDLLQIIQFCHEKKDTLGTFAWRECKDFLVTTFNIRDVEKSSVTSLKAPITASLIDKLKEASPAPDNENLNKAFFYCGHLLLSSQQKFDSTNPDFCTAVLRMPSQFDQDVPSVKLGMIKEKNVYSRFDTHRKAPYFQHASVDAQLACLLEPSVTLPMRQQFYAQIELPKNQDLCQRLLADETISMEEKSEIFIHLDSLNAEDISQLESKKALKREFMEVLCQQEGRLPTSVKNKIFKGFLNMDVENLLQFEPSKYFLKTLLIECRHGTPEFKSQLSTLVSFCSKKLDQLVEKNKKDPNYDCKQDAIYNFLIEDRDIPKGFLNSCKSPENRLEVILGLELGVRLRLFQDSEISSPIKKQLCATLPTQNLERLIKKNINADLCRQSLATHQSQSDSLFCEALKAKFYLSDTSKYSCHELETFLTKAADSSLKWEDLRLSSFQDASDLSDQRSNFELVRRLAFSEIAAEFEQLSENQTALESLTWKKNLDDLRSLVSTLKDEGFNLADNSDDLLDLLFQNKILTDSEVHVFSEQPDDWPLDQSWKDAKELLRALKNEQFLDHLKNHGQLQNFKFRPSTRLPDQKYEAGPLLFQGAGQDGLTLVFNADCAPLSTKRNMNSGAMVIDAERVKQNAVAINSSTQKGALKKLSLPKLDQKISETQERLAGERPDPSLRYSKGTDYSEVLASYSKSDVHGVIISRFDISSKESFGKAELRAIKNRLEKVNVHFEGKEMPVLYSYDPSFGLKPISLELLAEALSDMDELPDLPPYSYDPFKFPEPGSRKDLEIKYKDNGGIDSFTCQFQGDTYSVRKEDDLELFKECYDQFMTSSIENLDDSLFSEQDCPFTAVEYKKSREMDPGGVGQQGIYQKRYLSFKIKDGETRDTVVRYLRQKLNIPGVELVELLKHKEIDSVPDETVLSIFALPQVLDCLGAKK